MNWMRSHSPMSAASADTNRSSADIVFRRELEDIALHMPTVSLVPVLTEPEPGWPGKQGKVDEAMLRKWVTDPDRSLFWVSGPPAMVTGFRVVLKQVGVKDEIIRTDRFIGY